MIRLFSVWPRRELIGYVEEFRRFYDMKEKIQSAWERFDTWYWISGARELVDISSKAIKFFGCFMISSTFIMGGGIYLQELWTLDPWSPILMVCQTIGFYVSLMGAAYVARS